MEHHEMTQEISRLKEDLINLRGVVKGNGSIGHEQRLSKLEVSWENREMACYGLKAVEQLIQERNKNRSWRIGDIANLIQIGVLLIMLYGIFFI